MWHSKKHYEYIEQQTIHNTPNTENKQASNEIKYMLQVPSMALKFWSYPNILDFCFYNQQ